MGSKWPKFLDGCIICKRSWPEAQHRSRGLCSRCYATVKSEGILDEFPTIPEDLSDAKYELLLSDPRAFVIDICTISHANTFSDEDIEEEGWRILRGMIRRWRGDYVQLYSAASLTDILSHQSSDYTDEHLPVGSVPGAKASALPSEAWWVSVKRRWEGEFTRLAARSGLGPPTFTHKGAVAKFKWKVGYSYVCVKVAQGSDALIVVENEYEGRVARKFTYGRLRAALRDLADPISPKDFEACDD